MLARDLKSGNIIKINNDLYRVTSVTKVKPGKGGALVPLVATHVIKGTKHDFRFRVNDKIERENVFERKATYLYHDHNQYYFLSEDEQLSCPSELIPNKSLITDEIEVMMATLSDGTVIRLDLPDRMKSKVVREISKSLFKLKNDLNVNGPTYIKVGDEVIFSYNSLDIISRV